MTAIWAERERMIGAVVENTAAVYGELSAIAGKGIVPEIEGLALPEGK